MYCFKNPNNIPIHSYGDFCTFTLRLPEISGKKHISGGWLLLLASSAMADDDCYDMMSLVV
jgi:hypothetical protein